MNKKKFIDKINVLIDAGKKKGYITYEEISSVFDDDMDVKLMERIFDELYRRGAKIEDEFSYSIKKNYKKKVEETVKDFVDTPEKFYFFELRSNSQFKGNEDRDAYYSKKITDIKLQIRNMIIRTNYFIIKILKDMYKIKRKYVPMDMVFNGSDNFKKEDVVRLHNQIKGLYKSKIIQGYKDGSKNIVLDDDIFKLLQGVDIKFKYCMEVLKEVIDKNKEVIKLESSRENIKKEYNLNDAGFDDIFNDILKEYPFPMKATAPVEQSVKKYIKKYRLIEKWIQPFRIDKKGLRELSTKGEKMIRLYEEVKEILINLNLPTVINIAKLYRDKEVLFQDLIQEGNLAVLEAIERYDFYKCNKNFTSYVRWWIRDRISKMVAYSNAPVRLSRELKKEVEFFLKKTAVMRNRLLRQPTQEEIAAELNWSIEKVFEITQYIKKIVSLDDDQNDRGGMKEYISDEKSLTPLELAINNILKEKLKDIILNLPYIEQKVIEMRFGINEYQNSPLYYDEIAVLLKLSVDEVKQVEQRALRRLKDYGKKDGLDQFLD